MKTADLIENGELNLEGCAAIRVLAPHPDDETIGCGGVIAAARDRSLPVQVHIMSDGAASHPGSVDYPPRKLATIREAECVAALSELGVAQESITFHALQDGASELWPFLPELEDDLVGDVLTFWPHRTDNHADHRATREIGVRLFGYERALSYLVWPGDIDAGEPLCRHYGDGARKSRALARHRTQLGLVTDSETGFTIDPQLFAQFAQGTELFYAP